MDIRDIEIIEYECICSTEDKDIVLEHCYYCYGALRHSAPLQLAPPRLLIIHQLLFIHYYFFSGSAWSAFYWFWEKPHFSTLIPFSRRFYLFLLSLYPGYSIRNGQSEADSQGNQPSS